MANEHYPEETRNLAYKVWALEAQRRPMKVVEILMNRYELEVPVRTIQDWVTRYEWVIQVEHDMALVGGPLHQEQIVELFLAAKDARVFLRDLMQQAIESPGKVATTYGRALGPLVNAAMGTLDRAGYSHLGRILARVHEIDDPSIAEAIAGVETLSIEELMERDRAMVDAERKRLQSRTTKR